MSDLETTDNGVPFDWELAGRAGAAFTLKPVKGVHTEEQVSAARRELRGSRDVVTLRVEWQQPGADERPGSLFIGVFPGGISYCDRRREEHGDYQKIAFLPYRSLELKIYHPKSDLLPAIEKHAADIQAKRGQPFEISTCGQTVMLGEAQS
jgi:hypothetical protein